MTQTHWIITWRSHVAAGRAELCGYETGVNVCSKPNAEGKQIIECVRCKLGTQQNRFARLASRAALKTVEATP